MENFSVKLYREIAKCLKQVYLFSKNTLIYNKTTDISFYILHRTPKLPLHFLMLLSKFI